VSTNRLFINLTPLIPLSLKRGGGKYFIEEGLAAPLKHPIKLGSLSKENEGEIIERGQSPLFYLHSPFS